MQASTTRKRRSPGVSIAAAALLLPALGGCAVIAVGDAIVSVGAAAVSVAATTVNVGARAVGAAVDAVTPGDGEKR